jgi:tripartite ATP-independent transporter DctP family solute receptor
MFSFLLLLAGCSSDQKSTAAPAQPKKLIRVGYVTAPGSAGDLGAKKFKELVEQRANGRVEVQLFPSSQLGGENDMVKLLQNGSLEVEICGDGPLNVYAPQYGALTMLYAFRNADHMQKVFRGPIGQELNDALIKSKDTRIADVWIRGPRYITSNKMIRSVSDLKGLKIRVPEMKVYLESFKAYGATPTPIAFSELYTALQQGVVDAQENPIDNIYTASLYQVQKYLVETAHVYGPFLVLMSNSFYQKLPDDLKKTVSDSLQEAGEYEKTKTLEEEQREMKEVQAKGMKVIEVDRKQFVDKLAGVPQKLETELSWKPGIYKQIVETQ